MTSTTIGVVAALIGLSLVLRGYATIRAIISLFGGLIADALPKTPTILVVEDEVMVRDMIEKVLRRAGYGVLLASEGQQAIRYINETGIDLIITDLFMPEMDGIELVVHLREQSRAIPVIAISGALSGQCEDLLRAAGQLGAALTLQKPFRVPDLLAAVSQLAGTPAPQPRDENGS